MIFSASAVPSIGSLPRNAPKARWLRLVGICKGLFFVPCLSEPLSRRSPMTWRRTGQGRACAPVGLGLYPADGWA